MEYNKQHNNKFIKNINKQYKIYNKTNKLKTMILLKEYFLQTNIFHWENLI